MRKRLTMRLGAAGIGALVVLALAAPPAYRDHEVLSNREARKDRLFLRDPDHAGGVDPVAAPGRDVQSVELNASGLGQDPHESAEEGGLPRPVATHQASDRAPWHLEGHVPQHDRAAVAGVEAADAQDGGQ